MKKILCLAFVMILTLVPNVHAESATNLDNVSDEVINIIQDMLYNIRMEPEGYGFSDVDFSNLSLGSGIPAYDNYEQITDISYYPIFEGNYIIAIATIHVDPSGNPHVMIGVDFASELQEYAKKHKSYALLFEDDNLYAVSPKGKGFLHSYPNLNNGKAKFGFIRKYKIEYSRCEPLISLSNEDASIDDVSILADYKYLNVPIKLQGEDPICWAACVASMGQYRTGTDKTARQVCDDAGVGYVGQNIVQSQQHLEDQYDYSTDRYLNPPGVQDITWEINHDRPMFVAYIDLSGRHGHTVVYRGYGAGTQSYYISYMDPNSSNYKGYSVTKDGDYRIVYGSIVLYCFGYFS